MWTWPVVLAFDDRLYDLGQHTSHCTLVSFAGHRQLGGVAFPQLFLQRCGRGFTSAAWEMGKETVGFHLIDEDTKVQMDKAC